MTLKKRVLPISSNPHFRFFAHFQVMQTWPKSWPDTASGLSLLDLLAMIRANNHNVNQY